jgi:NAD(P)H-flavin reductase
MANALSGALPNVANSLRPSIATIEKVIVETGAQDVRTFHVVIDNPDERFTWKSGQCAMLSLFGVGEVMISITQTPTRSEHLEFSIKNAGRVTNLIHQLKEGAKIGVRGPYGNNFDLESFYGRNVVFIGGGIGLAPVRSVINNALDNRDKYGKIDIIYGARSPGDLVFKYELFENWPKYRDVNVYVTVDRGDENWKGNVGFVPAFTEQVKPSPDDAVAIVCGPPIMIKFTLQTMAKLGFTDDQIITTLEMKMQCGVGKCGRCNIGDKFVCIDGPVFTLSQMKAMPQEF